MLIWKDQEERIRLGTVLDKRKNDLKIFADKIRNDRLDHQEALRKKKQKEREKDKNELQKKRAQQFDLKTINIKNQKKDLEAQLLFYKNLVSKK